MPANLRRERDEPFPTRGSRCFDWWNLPDVQEVATIRVGVAAFDAAMATEWRAKFARTLGEGAGSRATAGLASLLAALDSQGGA